MTNRFTLNPRQIKAMGANLTDDHVRGMSAEQLARLGVSAVKGITDSAIGAPSVSNYTALSPAAYLSPRAIRQIYIDQEWHKLAGRTQEGTFFNDNIVTPVWGRKGSALVYGDRVQAPLVTLIHSDVTRDTVQFHIAKEDGYRELGQDALTGRNTPAEKEAAAMSAVRFAMNNAIFYGVAGQRTYGITNEPNLDAYVSVAKTWPSATYAEIQQDIINMVIDLQDKSRGLVDENANMTLTLPVGFAGVMQKVNSYDQKSLKVWFAENYPNSRIEYVNAFKGANGGANVAYLVVDSGSFEGEAVTGIEATNQADAHVIITAQTTVGPYTEYAGSTAGALVRHPQFVTRISGV